ncbi:MAG: DNA-binding protein [bacterium]|nr:DNA-binding protein [bacterium]
MPTLTIRNIPEELLDDLRRLAKQERRSLNAQVIKCLELSRRSRTVEEINAFRQAVYKRRGLGSDSTEQIRRMRDQRAAPQGQ